MTAHAALILGWLALPLPAATTPAPHTLSVCLQPLGTHDAQMLVAARRGIEGLLGLRVRVLSARPLPGSAFYPPRKRYRAERLLEYLAQRVQPGSGCNYVLGMTSRDVSTTKGDVADWGVFGLGARPGPVAVVSTYRLRGSTATRRQLAIRVVKVVNHELGHNLGLDHCPAKSCLMEDARGTIRTVDDETGLLCPICCAWLLRAHGLAPPQPSRVEWETLLRGIN
jgi:archaemetzincin